MFRHRRHGNPGKDSRRGNGTAGDRGEDGVGGHRGDAETAANPAQQSGSHAKCIPADIGHIDQQPHQNEKGNNAELIGADGTAGGQTQGIVGNHRGAAHHPDTDVGKDDQGNTDRQSDGDQEQHADDGQRPHLEGTEIAVDVQPNINSDHYKESAKKHDSGFAFRFRRLSITASMGPHLDKMDDGQADEFKESADGADYQCQLERPQRNHKRAAGAIEVIIDPGFDEVGNSPL